MLGNEFIQKQKRWLIVARLARARNKSIKIKIILNITLMVFFATIAHD